MIDVMLELKEPGACYSAGDYSVGLKKIVELWDRIPEPKTETSNAYLVIEYAVAMALKLANLEEAKKWSDRAPAFIEKRKDMGEVELLQGKVAYERGEIEAAKLFFKAANKKSRGRAFQDEDAKYKALLKA